MYRGKNPTMKLRNARDRLLHRRLRSFARALPDACGGDPSAVHKARVASRRLREALPVVLADVPAKKANRLARGFRRITRALGPVREVDVTIAALEAATAQFPDAAASLQAVAVQLHADRDRRRDEMLGRLENIDADRLVARVDAFAGTATQPAAVAHSVSRAVLAVRMVRRSRDLHQAVAAAGALYAPEPLHAVRIAAKKLRYAMELAHELRLFSSRRALRQLERMQDTLGHLHDLQILIERLAAAQATFPVPELVLADLAHVSGALDDECRRFHADYVGGRDAMLAAVDDALEMVTAGPVRDVETEPVSTSVH
jgi:CHAD domain-containing protein